jgi:hypothetical protein
MEVAFSNFHEHICLGEKACCVLSWGKVGTKTKSNCIVEIHSNIIKNKKSAKFSYNLAFSIKKVLFFSSIKDVMLCNRSD